MKILTTVVRRLKCRFEEAFDGAEAVEKFKSFNPSIVLLDISLPILDGFEVCTRMRAHKTNVVPKIVAITALSSHEDKMRGLNECGMDDWRTKPVAVRTLSQDLATWKKAWENQHTPSPTQA